MQVYKDQFNRSKALFEVSKYLPRLKAARGIRSLDITYNDSRRYIPNLLPIVSEWLAPTNQLRLLHIPARQQLDITGPATIFVFQVQDADERELAPGSVITIDASETFYITQPMLSSAVLGLAWGFLQEDPIRETRLQAAA